jgi:ribosomal protein S18 acetylase RimI-like enzyme
MSDVVFGRMVYRNYCEMWRNVGACDGDNTVFKVEDRPDMLLVRSTNVERVPHMVLDPVVALGDEHRWTQSLVREWSGEPVSLMVGVEPGTEKGNLVGAFRSEGFVQGVRPSVAMVKTGRPEFERRLDADICLAASDNDLEDARVLLAKVFGLHRDIFAFYTPRECVKTFVLREHGIAVAAACLCPFAGAAGVYSVGVLPEKRGRGYAQRLVLRLLSAASEMGLSTAVLSCEQGLVPLYRRLGFSVCWELMTYWMEAWWR